MDSAATNAEDNFSAAQHFGGIMQTAWTKPASKGITGSAILDFAAMPAKAPCYQSLT